MAHQADNEQCSLGRELTGDEIDDGASVERGRRRSVNGDGSSTVSSGGWQDEMMRAADLA